MGTQRAEAARRVSRAERYAALGDEMRLAIVDELRRSDRSPVELRRLLGLESNLVAHHLDALERVGLVVRTPSSGDRRRRYVRLVPSAFDDLQLAPERATTPALFVCRQNSARSQLAAAIWTHRTGRRALSAGTHPADRVHPGAVAAASRAGLDLDGAAPRSLATIDRLPPLVVTVCDVAHEELAPDPGWLHWSIDDPAADGRASAFDRTVAELTARIANLIPTATTGKDPS